MDIRHFRYFLAVARHGHFTRAAEQLGIAPPTLTRQIQDMENELGTRLFVRQTREVSLTEAGAALLIEAEATVRQFEYAQRNAQRAGRGDIGHIELGYVASAVYSGLLQKQVQAFSRECPDVSLNVRESPMASLPAMVLEGRFDIGYVRSPMTLPDGLEALRLDAEGFVLALALSGFFGQLAITKAFSTGKASIVAPFEYTALAWGVAIDWLLWQALPDGYTLLGAGIIIASGTYLVRRESAHKESEHP